MPEPGEPQDFNRYAYVRNNPLKYFDPSGHITVDPERAQKLHDFGLALLDLDRTPMQRFIAFMHYASFLYENTETDQFMVDVTAVLHGHEYDTEGGYQLYEMRRDSSSDYFIGWDAFHTDMDIYPKSCTSEYCGMLTSSGKCEMI